MGIDGIPKVTGGAPAGENAAGKEASGNSKPVATTPEAMERPAGIAQPDTASTHPMRQPPGRLVQLHQRELAKLRESLRASGTAAREAGKQALALAASYTMRRSRGARRQALDLCAEVEAEVEELAGLARDLQVILSAEGDLHETSAEATLRACRALVDVLDRLEDEEEDEEDEA